MADRKPLKVLPDGGGDSTGLAEFVAADTIGVADGGTGLTTVAASNLLTGNGASALSAESSLTFDGSTLAVSADQYIANGKGLVVGNATAVGGSHGYEIQALGTGGLDAGVTMGNWAASAVGPVMSFIKSRHATIGSNTIVQDDDVLGSIYFTADDGTDFESRAAEIRANIDGTPGANDTPGRLTFYTAADGANTSTERMRIDSAGAVTMPTQPCFLARLGSNRTDVTGNNAVYTVPYDTEIFDQGADFASSTFTAPVAGKYQFNATVQVTGFSAANWVWIQLVAANRTTTLSYFENPRTTTTMNGSSLMDMDVGDSAYIIVQSNGESSDIVDLYGGATEAYFSGALIA